MGQGGSRATEVDFGEAAAELVRARGDPAAVAARAAHVWRTGVAAGLPLRAFACAFGVRQVRALRDRRAGGAPGGAALAAYLEQTAAYLSRHAATGDDGDGDGPEVVRGCLDALACVLPVALEPDGAQPFADAVLFAPGSTLAARLLDGVVAAVLAPGSGGGGDADDAALLARRASALRALLACGAECLFWPPSALVGADRCCAGGFLDALTGVGADGAEAPAMAPERRTALVAALLAAVFDAPPQPPAQRLLPWRTQETLAPAVAQLAAQALLVLLAWQPCGPRANAVGAAAAALLAAPGAAERVLGALARMLATAVAEEEARRAWAAPTVACFRELLLLAWALLRGCPALLDTCLAQPALAQPVLAAALWALARGKTHRTQSGLVQLCANTLLLASTRAGALPALRAPLLPGTAALLAPLTGRLPGGATLLDAALVLLARVFAPPAGAAPDRVLDTALGALANAVRVHHAAHGAPPAVACCAEARAALAALLDAVTARPFLRAGPACPATAARLCTLVAATPLRARAAAFAEQVAARVAHSEDDEDDDERAVWVRTHEALVGAAQWVLGGLEHSTREARWLLALVWSVALTEVAEPCLECRAGIQLFSEPELCGDDAAGAASSFSSSFVPVPRITTECTDVHYLTVSPSGGYFQNPDNDGFSFLTNDDGGDDSDDDDDDDSDSSGSEDSSASSSSSLSSSSSEP